MSHLIYIGDASIGMARQIEYWLKEVGMKARSFEVVQELQAAIERMAPGMLVLEKSFYRDPELWEIARQIPVVLYADTMDVNERMVLYNQGVKRVLIGAENRALKIAAVIKGRLYRNHTLERRRQRCLTGGKLQHFSFQDLITNALLEKKHFVFKINYQDWHAKIRTSQGHLVEAVASDVQGEEALLKALHVTEGTVMVRKYQENSEEITTELPSVLAIMSEARFQQQEIQRFCEQYGNGKQNPEFRGRFKGTAESLSDAELKVLDVVQGRRSLQEIFLKSALPVIKTVRILKKFLTEGTLLSETDDDFEALSTFQDQDIEYFRRKLFRPYQKEGTLIVLGGKDSGRRELVRTLADSFKTNIKSMQSLELANINIQPDMRLNIIGISTEDAFLPVMDKVAEEMIGCIFLVDAIQKEKQEFYSYLLNRMIRIYSTPFVIGVNRPTIEVKELPGHLDIAFTVPEGLRMLSVETASFKNVLNLLYHLRYADLKEEEEKHHE